MNANPRVVFLPDTFTEVNGVAHTARHLEAFARRRQMPFLSVHCGPAEERLSEGEFSLLQLKRGRASINLDANLDYDSLLWRYGPRIADEIRRFGGEVIHITGPGDLGGIGLYLSWRLKLPLVSSWHTNLHEYARTRSAKLMRKAGSAASGVIGTIAEKASLEILRQFYRCAEVTMAPNQELVEFTHRLTRKPCHLMSRGVDTELFAPCRRNRMNKRFQIGYVGRLTPEKNVRLLARMVEALKKKCKEGFEFVIVGEGSEEGWLRKNVPQARFLGVLRGEELAEAYANMDVFVFPSETDTFGNVILEALASGVPTVVSNQGGPKYLVQPGLTGYIAASEEEFVDSVSQLMGDENLRMRMSQAAIGYAREQSWDRVFESVWSVYGEAIGLHRSAKSTAKRFWRRTSSSLLSSRVHGRSSS